MTSSPVCEAMTSAQATSLAARGEMTGCWCGRFDLWPLWSNAEVNHHDPETSGVMDASSAEGKSPASVRFGVLDPLEMGNSSGETYA